MTRLGWLRLVFLGAGVVTHSELPAVTKVTAQNLVNLILFLFFKFSLIFISF